MIISKMNQYRLIKKFFMVRHVKKKKKEEFVHNNYTRVPNFMAKISLNLLGLFLQNLRRFVIERCLPPREFGDGILHQNFKSFPFF